MQSPQHRDGVLVISAWVDPESEEFRARIMRTADPSTSEHEFTWAATPEDVVAAVGAWLEELTGSSGGA